MIKIENGRMRVSHGITMGMPNYNSVRTEVSLECDIPEGSDLSKFRRNLSKELMTELKKQVEGMKREADKMLYEEDE